MSSRRDYDPLDYNPNDPIFDPDAGAAADAGAADGNDANDYNALFDAMLQNGAPAPAPAPAPALREVMPADVARRAIACAGGICPITLEDLQTMKTKQKAVTSCGHVFDKDYITHVKSLGGVCPTCRSEFEINPIHKADVVGRPTFVPRHMKMPMAVRGVSKGEVGAHSRKGKLSESAYHMCNQCGKVVDKIPVPNKCPKCKKMGAFSGGSRKHKRNIRRKSKKLIKRKKTMKRR